MAFYALTTGEFQFNIGPDAQGREWAVIVDGLPALVIYGYEVGANQSTMRATFTFSPTADMMGAVYEYLEQGEIPCPNAVPFSG